MAKKIKTFEDCKSHLDTFIKSPFTNKEGLIKQVNSWVTVPIEQRKKLIQHINKTKK
jgi:hypothetical protein